jgi:hypothetical protein
MEATGGLEAADRAAGALARSGAAGADAAAAASLADKDATTVSRQPQQLLGNAATPRDPYSKGLVRNLRQKAQDPSVRPGQSILDAVLPKDLSTKVPNKGLGRQLTTHFDRQAGGLESVRRVNRGEVIDKRMEALKGSRIQAGVTRDATRLHVPIAGSRAVNPFARGLLADPKVLDPHTGQPLYRTQLSNLVEYHNHHVPGETGAERELRMNNVAHYQGLLDEKRLQEHPEKAYQAARSYATDMRKLEPELVEHRVVGNPQSLRVAKLTDPFQFHWDGQDPMVEENPPLTGKGISYDQAVKAREDAYTARRGSKIELDRARSIGDDTKDIEARHRANLVAHRKAVADLRAFGDPAPGELQESPFSIAGKNGQRQHIPISQVEKDLKDKHGVDPDQIGFVSNRPYVSDSSAYYKDTTDPRNAGYNPQKFRTGGAFKRGQYDPTPDALTRQHVSNQALVDQGRGSRLQVKTYALTREHLAKLLDEHPDDPHAKLVARELRTGNSTFFDKNGETSAWDSAQRAIREVERLKPDLKLKPGRIAHQYAPKTVLSDLARITSPRDALDPQVWSEERGLDQFPKDAPSQQLDSGPVGVYHDAIVKQLSAYNKDTGSTIASVLRSPASFWRRANIAFSPRHPFGIAQELGIRAGVNHIGPLSLLRGYRRLNLIERALEDPNFVKDHPDAELDAQRLKAQVRGTVAHQTEMLQRHVQSDTLREVPGIAGKALRATGKGLKPVKMIAKAYSDTAGKILSAERRVLEHPAQIAGLGKVANDEARAIMGKSLPAFGAVTKAEESLARGSLDPKAVDFAARRMTEFWGDWNSASPATKHAMSIAPFWTWYRNSLKFLYVSMPMHHPVKTALLTVLEQATAQQRSAIGQGLNAKEKLEWEQQGSIPIGSGYVANQQYYTPQGAVGSPLSTPLDLLVPEIKEAIQIAGGSNSYGETLENADKEPIVDPGERATLAALSILESFVPPMRQALTVAKGGKSAENGSTLWNLKTKGAPSEDPIGKALGIPPGIWNAFRPFKTSKERTESGEPRETSALRLPSVNLPEVKLPTVNVPSINLGG